MLSADCSGDHNSLVPVLSVGALVYGNGTFDQERLAQRVPAANWEAFVVGALSRFRRIGPRLRFGSIHGQGAFTLGARLRLGRFRGGCSWAFTSAPKADVFYHPTADFRTRGQQDRTKSC
jgi:hypothetical protein